MTNIGWAALFAALTLLIVFLIYGKATGRREYKRFMARVDCPSIHLVAIGARQDETWHEGTFLRGVVFFNDGTSFHFTNPTAFRRVAKEFRLAVDHSRRIQAKA